MKIIFEDGDIIVCNKPEGIASQGDDKANENAISFLERHTGATVYSVHRLDKTTSGLMVFAKNTVAAANLSKQFSEHSVLKKYTALIHGVPQYYSGSFEDLIFFDSTKNKSFIAKRERRGVKKAVLSYSVIKEIDLWAEKISLVEILLGTGRTHQIRVQFASRKMPLLGDNRYGAHDTAPRIMLKSSRLSFCHPTTGENLTFALTRDEAEFSQEIRNISAVL